MRRGFTLIELLAVIVILAIIATIATPIILNIIKDTKKSANIRSIENYVRSAEILFTDLNMKNEVKEGNYSPSELNNLGIQVTGDTPKGVDDYIIYSKGSIKSYRLTLDNRKYILANGKKYVLDLNEDLVYKITGAETTRDENGITIHIVSDWEFVVLDTGKIQLTKYLGSDTTLIVPGKVNNYYVYSIGNNNSEYLFEDDGHTFKSTKSINILGNLYDWYNDEPIKSSFDTVIFSSGIEKVDDFAFYFIKSVNAIELSNTITSIGDMAFEQCNLSTLIIPEQITYIGKNAFEKNYNLTDVYYNAINVEPVYYNFTTNYVYPIFSSDLIEKIVIGNKVETLPKLIFRDINGSSKITEITIPESVKYIGENAFSNNLNLKIVHYNAINASTGYSAPVSTFYPIFYGCPLENIIIDDDVETISDYLFADGSSTFNVTEITIPENVTYIGYNAFGYNIKLKTVYYNAINLEQAGRNPSGLYNVAFKKSPLNSVIIGPKVKIIPGGLFLNSSSAQTFTFTHVDIPASVEKINTKAFMGNTKLQSIRIHKNLKDIGDSAFKNNTGLKTIYYDGTTTDFAGITINDVENTYFKNATIVYE